MLVPVSEYPPYFINYIDKAENFQFIDGLKESKKQVVLLFEQLPSSKL